MSKRLRELLTEIRVWRHFLTLKRRDLTSEKESKAVNCLVAIGLHAVPSLIRLLRSGETKSRRVDAIISGLIRIGRVAVEPLICLLESNEVCAASAVDVLVGIGGPAVLPLIEILDKRTYNGTQNDSAAKQFAADVLGRLGDVRAVDPLKHVIFGISSDSTRRDFDLKCYLRALASIDNAAAVEALEMVLRTTACTFGEIDAVCAIKHPRLVRPLLIGENSMHSHPRRGYDDIERIRNLIAGAIRDLRPFPFDILFAEFDTCLGDRVAEILDPKRLELTDESVSGCLLPRLRQIIGCNRQQEHVRIRAIRLVSTWTQPLGEAARDDMKSFLRCVPACSTKLRKALVFALSELGEAPRNAEDIVLCLLARQATRHEREMCCKSINNLIEEGEQNVVLSILFDELHSDVSRYHRASLEHFKDMSDAFQILCDAGVRLSSTQTTLLPLVSSLVDLLTTLDLDGRRLAADVLGLLGWEPISAEQRAILALARADFTSAQIEGRAALDPMLRFLECQSSPVWTSDGSRNNELIFYRGIMLAVCRVTCAIVSNVDDSVLRRMASQPDEVRTYHELSSSMGCGLLSEEQVVVLDMSGMRKIGFEELSRRGSLVETI